MELLKSDDKKETGNAPLNNKLKVLEAQHKIQEMLLNNDIFKGLD